MKTVFVILVLLVAAEWQKKEACKTQKHRWQKIKYDDNQNPVPPYIIHDSQDNDAITETIVRTCHLLIIGAGSLTVALLDILSNKTRTEEDKRTLTEPKNRVRMIIVEEKNKFGPGSPYDWDVANSEHLTNTFFFSDLSIVSKEPEDFAKWISWVYPRVQREPDAQVVSPTPRWIVGQYLQARFHHFGDECQEKYEITLIDSTSAGKVSRGDGVFVVQLSDGSQVHTTDIVLATGHWSSSLFGKDKVEGFFPSPWPASALTHRVTGIPAHAKVGILDSGRNAIDAVMTLAHKHGNFTPVQHQHGLAPTYEYTPNSKHFHITMYSRRGVLPAVSGLTYDYEFSVMGQYDDEVVPKDVDEEMASPDGEARPQPDGEVGAQSDGDDLADEIQSLDDVLRTLQADLAITVDDVPEFQNAKHFIQDIDYFMYQGKPPRERLEDDIKRARESWQKRQPLQPLQPLELQSFFIGVKGHFTRFLPDFPPNDTFTFETIIAPDILNYAQPMPLDTAEKLLALMKAKCLIVVATGAKREVVKNRNNKGVHITYGRKHKSKIPHDYFIDASEQSGDIKSNPSPLVQSLFANKFIQPNYLDLHPLPNEDRRIEKVDTMKRDETTNKIQKTTKKLYRSDGIKMDMETMRVIPPDDADEPSPGVIYATGPFTSGQYAFGEGLPHVVYFAELAAYDIKKHRLEKYNTINLDAK